MQNVKPETFGVVSALIVDDSAFDRRRIARIAQNTGIDFLFRDVSSVQEFGHILDQEKFDVIYVDLNLAGDDGTRLLPGVRAHQVNKNAAMIMIAGNNQAETALAAIRAGFADYIEKDALTAATLERATLNALQKIRLSQAATAAETETKSVEALLKSFADACSREMRPMMTRMVRQVRQIKSDCEQLGLHPKSLDDVERTCARMDEFFQDLGGLANAQQLSTIVSARSSPVKDVAMPEPDDAKTDTANFAARPQQPPAKPRSRLFLR